MLRRAAALVVILLITLAAPSGAFETAARAGILVDAQSGTILFEKDADRQVPPASMSKLMTAYLVFERLAAGRLSLDDTLPVSEKAWRTGGSKMFVDLGSRVAVRDLLRGMIVQSGNDACIVLAEGLSGSEEAFATEMNEVGRRLGLTNSHFTNSTGWPDPAHFMSVRDLATLGRRIIEDFPDLYRLYAEMEFEYNGIKQGNRNPLLQAGVPGVDGIKTGHTEEAGYGLAASAERNGQRLILVLVGMSSMRERRAESERLLEYGFREFRHYRLFERGQAAAEIPVWLGAAPSVPLVPARPVGITLPPAARDRLAVKLHYSAPVPAPVAAGQELGRIEVTAPGVPAQSVPLLAGRDVAPAGPLGRLTGTLSYLVWGAS